MAKKPKEKVEKQPSTEELTQQQQHQNSSSSRHYSSSSRSSTLTEIASEKGLICVQVVVLVQLLFDLVTSIIGLLKLLIENDDCCGYELDVFELPLPLGQIISGPFIFLILLELLFLLRSVVVDTAKKKKKAQEEEEESEGQEETQPIKQSCCAKCMKYNGKALLSIINKIVLINPFFGCFIAWMLLYQSDRTECFLVLGLEFGSIVLHFIAVGLTETIRSWKHLFFHCIQLIPFLASVALILIYMKQQGVCYIVEEALFYFQGCELCPDGYPPKDGKCTDIDGVSWEFSNSDLFDLGNWESVTSKSDSNQGRFCGSWIEKDDIRYEDGKWENTHFCFFPYE